jgi:hypothetical protein
MFRFPVKFLPLLNYISPSKILMMPEKYILNMNPEENGFNDVHKAACVHVPKTNCEEIGAFFAPASAVMAAKLRHPYRKIKGCYYCFGMS